MAEKPSCLLLSTTTCHDLGIRDCSSVKKTLQPKHVWSVRVRLEISRKWRDLAHLALVDHSLLRMARRSLAAPNHVGPKPGFEVILYMIVVISF